MEHEVAHGSGERTRLACGWRRLAATNFVWGGRKKVRDGEGAIAGTRGACVPQSPNRAPLIS